MTRIRRRARCWRSCEAVVVKLGADGALVRSRDGSAARVEAVARRRGRHHRRRGRVRGRAAAGLALRGRVARGAGGRIPPGGDVCDAGGRAPLTASVGRVGHNHAMARRTAAPPRALRGAHRRHRRRRRDAGLLPRVRLLGHLLARPARRPRRPEAGAAPDPVPDGRDGPAPRPRARQERPRRRRGHGQAAPARRRGDLRRARPDGAAVLDAGAAGRRPRQLRLARRRPARGHALHRVPAGARGAAR